jgi:RNA polymerase sigma factor (sigma-70 family)
MKQKNYSDTEIVKAIQGDNPDDCNAALRQLYMDTILTAKVKDMIKMFGTSRIDADDVLQEGIMLLYDLIRDKRFQQKSKVRTFLLGICKNLIRNSNKKVDRILLNEEIKDDLLVGNPYETPEIELLLVEKTEQEDARDKILENLLEAMSENCKSVLTLYYFHSKNMTQIADERRLKNANMAKKAASRCREQLRSLIAEQPRLEYFLKLSL